LPIALNLTPVIGNVVSLEFSTYDCGATAHFGYAYVDIRCQNFTLSSSYCHNNKFAYLSAPAGFAQYVWDTAGTGPPVIATTTVDSISLSNPGSAMVYSVSLVPYSSPSCSLVVTDTLKLLPQPSAFFKFKTDSFACGLVSFFDSSVTNLIGSNIVKWFWNFGESSSATNLSSLKNPTHVYQKPGTYSVSMYAVSDLGCNSDTILRTIIINPSPLTLGFIMSSIDSVECSLVNFKDTSKTNLSYSNIVSWSWDFGDILSGVNNFSNLKNPSHRFLKAGKYLIKLAITTDIGCMPDTIQKIFIVKSIPIDAFAGRDTVFCQDGSMHLIAYANQDYAPYVYTWSPNMYINDITVLDPYVTPPTTQYYIFTAATLDGCSRTDSVLVSVSLPFHFDLPDSVAPNCLGRSVQLQFIPNAQQTGSKITWYSNNANATINCKNCYDPVYKSLKSDYVYAILYNEYWCSSRDTIWVPYIECPEIIVPSAFTPNGDGKNDNFFLLYKNFTKLNYFEVFNRWGEVVYTTNEITASGWDGKLKGLDQPQGVYIFKIMATDFNGELKSLNGNVTLIR
jgi:gliding motility-associated-like protein